MSSLNDFENIDGVLTKYCGSGGNVVIPKGITSIGKKAFIGCQKLKSIVIPEGVLFIEEKAFAGCQYMSSIVIPEGVISIGENAFSGCRYLTSIVLPNSVTHIGNSAFRRCKGLADECGMIIIRNVMYGYFGTDTNVVVPTGVTSIDDEAFFACRNLTGIVFPESVISIGNRAFSGCRNLESIKIPESVTFIGDQAFSHCNNLKSIVLPEGVTSIGNEAFSGCSNLTSIVIPEGVTSIGNKAIYECSSQMNMVISESAVFMINCNTAPNMNIEVVVKKGEENTYLAFASKAKSDNLTEFVSKQNWTVYDLELLNNGPIFKYKLPVRLLGMLGRLQNPVDLSDKNRQVFMELLANNVKKMVLIAEKLKCPDIIRTMLELNLVNDNNIKTVQKLLKTSKMLKRSLIFCTISDE